MIHGPVILMYWLDSDMKTLLQRKKSPVVAGRSHKTFPALSALTEAREHAMEEVRW